MSQKTLSLAELLDLIELEDNRGIISKKEVLAAVVKRGMPRLISDVRGSLRLAIERDGEGFSVTQYPTELANETIGAIYPVATNQDNRKYDLAA
jgi:hypothetical protein